MHHTSQGMYKKDILAKSINLEVFKTTLGCLLIFFLLVIASRLVGYYEQAAEGSIDPSIIIPVIALRMPDFITLLIPLSFFLGVLITTSRLYGDNEIYAIFSGGKSLIDIIKYLLPQAFLFLMLTASLSLNIAPYTKAMSKELMASKSFSEKIQSIRPNELTEIGKGNYIKAQSIQDGVLEEVIFMSGDIGSAALVSSKKLLISDANSTTNITFKDGIIYTDVINPDQQVITRFGEFEYNLDLSSGSSKKARLNKVYDFEEKSKNASFQWNLSIPLTIINLLFLGIFVGKAKPRQGRFGGIVPGLFIYMLYISLLVASRESMMTGGFLSSLGLWWVHALFFLLSLLYLSKYYFNFEFNILSSNSISRKAIIAISLFILSIWLIA
jgi:lipopolysaccharide export system permease protein